MKFISKITAIILLLNIIVISACNSNKTAEAETDDTSNDSIEIAILDTTAEVEIAEEITIEEKINDTVIVKKEKVIAKRKPLSLVITNLRSSTAPVIVSIYGKENKFPDPTGQLKEYKFKAKGKTLAVKITDIPFGTYALALYQDENSNGKIDKNFIGYPTEGFAFSNNHKPTIKAPSFENCAFNYNKESSTVSIKMLH